MGWVRRNPVWTIIIVVVFGLLFATSFAGDDPATAILGWAFVFLVTIGIIALINVIRSRRRSPDAASENVSAAQQASSASIPTEYTQSSVQPEATLFTTPPSAPMPTNPTYRAPSLGDVLALTPTQFEEAVRVLLATFGYQETKRMGGAGDLGADIVGRDPQGHSIIVQCKRFAPGGNVDTPIVQSFIGMSHVHHQAERGIIVTTVPFTQPAIDLAAQHNIVLIDGAVLVLLFSIAGMTLNEPEIRGVGRPQPTALIAAPQQVCPRCGTANEVTAKFCEKCGNRLVH